MVKTFNGRKVTNSLEMLRLIEQTEVGKTVELDIVRQGTAGKVTATVAEMPAESLTVPGGDEEAPLMRIIYLAVCAL